MPRDRTRAAYRALLRLYPRSFRERFAESMEQTFDDLRRERSAAGGREVGVVVRTFADTSLGVAHENAVALAQLKLAPQHRSALLGLLLSLPIGVLVPALWLDIAVVRDLLTDDGERLNVLGATLLLGGFVLLPVAFAVALRPLLRNRPGLRACAVNLLVCAVISVPIVVTLLAVAEEVYRCEVRAIANCD